MPDKARKRNYFGAPDASGASAESIIRDHVARDFEDEVKFGPRDHGTQVIVGIKGSGKTQLRRFIEETDKQAHIWNIDAEHDALAIDAMPLKGRSGVMKNSLALELLRGFASRFEESDEEEGAPERTAGRLRRAANRALEILKNIPEATDVDVSLVSVDLATLLKRKASPFVRNAWKQLTVDVRAALGQERAYIMIDDAEDVFPGLESNPTFIEALARAVHDINAATGRCLHVLLFLKQGVWRKWYENRQEYDKVEYIVQEISWDHDALCALIARRSARIHQKKLGDEIDVEGLWALEFSWEGIPFEDFAREFTSLCVSGPRDMVVLANRCKKVAGERKIQIGDLSEIVKRFSQDKVQDIGADYGSVYEELPLFVQRALRGCPIEMSGAALADWLDKKALTEPRVESHFKQHLWFATAAKERLAEILYEIGVVGLKSPEGEAVFSMHRPDVSLGEILDGDLVIHPAFRSHLAAKEPKQTK